MDDLKGTGSGLREIALFAGAGGGILGGHLLGWRTICAVERDPYAAGILAARQNDGHLPTFPIWDDVCTFDGVPWRGRCDVVSGGFPCQDISTAGRGAGIDGERSGLWREMARIIREVAPRYAFVENVPALCSRGLGRVLGDLAEMGYDARWCVLGAVDAGAPHKRERIWILASDSWRERGEGIKQKAVSGFDGFSWCKNVRRPEDLRNRSDIPEPLLCRVGNGLACGVDRLRAIGNGQVPAVAALAWRLLGGPG